MLPGLPILCAIKNLNEGYRQKQASSGGIFVKPDYEALARSATSSLEMRACDKNPSTRSMLTTS